MIYEVRLKKCREVYAPFRQLAVVMGGLGILRDRCVRCVDVCGCK